jgi:hypothetical protein
METARPHNLAPIAFCPHERIRAFQALVLLYGNLPDFSNFCLYFAFI